MDFQLNDGGRAAAGYKGQTGDCAVRSISIATGMGYQAAYDLVMRHCKAERPSKRRRGKSHPRTGVHAVTMQAAMAELGWTWVPTMGIGTGCTVHLDPDELPAGRIICRVSKHFCAVLDGVLHDTHNAANRGTTVFPEGFPENELPAGADRLEGGGWVHRPRRCVYGYWMKG